MPDPGAGGSPGYLWLFRFLHTVAGNITTAFGSKIPGLKTVVSLLLIPLLFTTTACAAHYTVHPGALNMTDSVTYDTLLIAETAIDQARMDFEAGHLPASMKPALDALIESYNVARQTWLIYRDAVTTNAPSQAYFDQLNQNVADLTNAIRAFEEAGQ